MSRVGDTRLSELDRRIVAALQVNGRASWRGIADALDESFSTVTRRGNALLYSGEIRVVTVVVGHASHLLYIDAEPAQTRAVADAIAEDPNTVFVYELGGSPNVVAEISMDEGDLAEFTHRVSVTLGGVRSVRVAPILKYFLTTAGWRPPILTDAQVDALDPRLPDEWTAGPVDVAGIDAEIVKILAQDGRSPINVIAEVTGLSESTARRRVEALFASGVLRTRVVVEPARLGLPVEALLWIGANPAAVADIGEAVAAVPGVRYVASVMGSAQLVVNVTLRSFDELQKMLTRPDWVARVSSLQSELVLAAYKRSRTRI
ncbi:Lrp/AsnC family transcriptional regulator [Gordonia jinhuaensis]|uniref:Transcriptional regulator n=1 Tax=Gordonia jinhuaensis TaxID=1517702 RepID=A0A916WTU2_9ACTN|nr:transcriptional regulator [Gordonia jinhuaensis]